MNIFVCGEEKRVEELKERLNQGGASINIAYGSKDAVPNEVDILIDLNFDDHPEMIESYSAMENTVFFVSSTKIELGSTIKLYCKDKKPIIAGFNALPSFINRAFWEISLPFNDQSDTINACLKDMGIESKTVADRVGMVSPRVIFLIINEAFITVQEGTANRTDIDLAMKLGTNYPYGPFEWANKIGINNVYEGLKAIRADTGDPRYNVCPLLKTEAL